MEETDLKFVEVVKRQGFVYKVESQYVVSLSQTLRDNFKLRWVMEVHHGNVVTIRAIISYNSVITFHHILLTWLEATTA